MIGRIEVQLRRMRRWLSRSEWGVLLLGLSRSHGTESDPGLILVQIDGLSRLQIESAIASGHMPFMKHLIGTEGYRMLTFYSGQPATTAAVQAELFYGLLSAVPAFAFRQKKTGRVVKMVELDAAKCVEDVLAKKGTGLLKGGSAYCNIYSGDASESHIVAAKKGVAEYLRAANPLWIFSMLILHGYSVLRVFVLAAIEILLAFRDFFHGIHNAWDLMYELLFIPKRVAVSILMREIATIGAQIDATRGLPIIQINLLGYDEQAHRRGPSSNFAHWTLGGIDDAIKRIRRVASRSTRREYELWIYSDHGQAATIPYYLIYGREINDVVAEIFGDGVDRRNHVRRRDRHSDWLGSRYYDESPGRRKVDPSKVVTVAIGPIGHIYSPRPLSASEKEDVAIQLVREGHVPLVIIPATPDEAVAWTDQGKFLLPADAEKIFGADHPFLLEVTHDLISTCHHPESGDFLISGWRIGMPTITFVYENGSHAGPHVEEVRAFALLPPDAPVEPPEGRSYIRALDLREGALIALKRSPVPAVRKTAAVRTIGDSIRIMTYNVHSCIGMDGRCSPERIARVIARYNPDVVALQELDVGRSRTLGMDQAHMIAHKLEMDFHFHPSLQLEEEQYGNAVLSRHPMRLVQAGALPALRLGGLFEPRGALWVSITIDHHEIQLFNTHLGLTSRERLLQTEALLGAEWIGHPDCVPPIILCGDVNAPPGSSEYRRLCGVLRDSQTALISHKPKNTWLGRYPLRRIDYIFVGANIAVRSIAVPLTELTRVASDHVPLIMEMGVDI